MPISQIHLQDLHSAKSKWFKKVDSRPIETKPIPKPSQVLPPFNKNTQAGLAQRILDGKVGFSRCLSTRTDKQRISRLSSLPLETDSFLLQCPSFWPVPGTRYLSRDDKFPFEESKSSRDTMSRLSGRYNNLLTFQTEMPERHLPNEINLDKTGIQAEPREVPTVPLTTDGMVRSSVEWRVTNADAPKRQNSNSESNGLSVPPIGILMRHLFRVENIDQWGSNWPLGAKMCFFDPKIWIFGAKSQFFV